MKIDRLRAIVSDEHGRVRDQLAELCSVFAGGDGEQARRLLRSITGFLGPHFRYEEESLFPVLASTGCRDRVERILVERDLAIGALERLVVLTCSEPLGRAEKTAAQRWIGLVLAHLLNCEALARAAEDVPDETCDRVLETRERALHAHVGLVEWATWLRERAPVAVP